MKLNKETIEMLCKFLEAYLMEPSYVKQKDIDYIRCFIEKVKNMDEYDMSAEEEKEIMLSIVCLVECCPYDIWTKDELTLLNALGLGELLARISIGDY